MRMEIAIQFMLPDLDYKGIQGTLKMIGKWGYFSQEKLKNKNHINSVHPSFDTSIKPFSNLKKSFYHAKQGNWREAAQKFLYPSIRINVDFQSNQGKGQVLGELVVWRRIRLFRFYRRFHSK